MIDLTVGLDTITCGDCLKVMPNIPNKCVDMILSDLPYSITACRWDTIIPFEPLWKEYKRIIKNNGAIVLTSTQPFTSALIMSNVGMFKYCWIYEKTKAPNYLQAKRHAMKYHEDVCVFYTGQCTYNPQMIIGNPYIHKHGAHNNEGVYYSDSRKKGHLLINKGYRYPSSIIRFKNPSGRGQLHPTQKPIDLFEYLIRTYTNENEIVLDNCIGSGTTAVACLHTGRHFIGIEKEKEYCRIARKRIQQFEWRKND